MVTVDGAGSTWNNSGNLYVGYSGTGLLTQTGGSVTIGGTLSLGAGSTGNGTYNLNGGMLILKSLSGGSGTAAFNFGGGTLQASGDFACSLPMTLTGTGGNANLDTNGHSVTLSGVLSGPGGLNKLGAGTAVLTGPNTYNGLTVVQQGVLELGSSAQNVIFNQGGADIRAGKLVFDYNGTTSPAQKVQAALATSYNNPLGHFAGGPLFTSTGSSAVGPGPYGLGWSDDGPTAGVRVQVAVYGDADLSGTVDFSDLGIVISNYGMTSGATWSQGDFNYDGAVDFSDLGIVIANYGISLPSQFDPAGAQGGPRVPMGGGTGSAVPEPGTLAMLAAGLIGLLAYAWRKRK